jgi:hypothetical protein
MHALLKPRWGAAVILSTLVLGLVTIQTSFAYDDYGDVDSYQAEQPIVQPMDEVNVELPSMSLDAGFSSNMPVISDPNFSSNMPMITPDFSSNMPMIDPGISGIVVSPPDFQGSGIMNNDYSNDTLASPVIPLPDYNGPLITDNLPDFNSPLIPDNLPDFNSPLLPENLPDYSEMPGIDNLLDTKPADSRQPVLVNLPVAGQDILGGDFSADDYLAGGAGTDNIMLTSGTALPPINFNAPSLNSRENRFDNLSQPPVISEDVSASSIQNQPEIIQPQTSSAAPVVRSENNLSNTGRELTEAEIMALAAGTADPAKVFKEAGIGPREDKSVVSQQRGEVNRFRSENELNKVLSGAEVISPELANALASGKYNIGLGSQEEGAGSSSQTKVDLIPQAQIDKANQQADLKWRDKMVEHSELNLSSDSSVKDTQEAVVKHNTAALDKLLNGDLKEGESIKIIVAH